MISTAKNRQVLIEGASAGGAITALTGDVTATGPGSVAATLATVNANVGTFGDASHVGQFTVNAKGLITAAASVAITPYSPPTYTAGSVLFAGAGGAPTQNNSNFFWDNSNIRLGIGTASPSVPLHVVGGVLQIDVYGSATSGFIGRSAGGTVGSPSQTAANTVLSSFTGRGYTNSGAFTANIGAINIVCVVAPTSTDQETTISMRVVPSGSTTNTTIFECYGNAAVVTIGFLSFNTRASTTVALKRSSTTLQTRLADDSAFAQFSALEFLSNRANFLMRTAVAWTNGAGALTGTLTNSPATGNPTKWIPVDDNGTTRFIPAW